MIYSIILLLTNELTTGLDRLSILYAPFPAGLVLGGATVYWFTGAATQAVASGALGDAPMTVSDLVATVEERLATREAGGIPPFG